MHIKRNTIKKFWPIPRKGTKYLARPTHDSSNSVPLVIIMRDVLKLVKNKKELKRLLNEKQVLINEKIIKETNYPLLLFDSLSLPIMNKSYRITLDNRKIKPEEIKGKEAEQRTYKVINKKQLAKGKIQLNLDSGKNILADSKLKTLKTGDFITLNSKNNEIIKTDSLKKGSKVFVIAGKHIGSVGEVKNLNEEGKNIIAEIKTKEGEIKVNVDNLFLGE